MADLRPDVTQGHGRVAVIGCGNPNRRDDGVGPRVVALLSAMELPESVALYDAGTDGMAVLYRARGVEELIVVDAKAPDASGVADPGAIYEVPGRVLEAPHAPSLSLHDFRWDHALYAGRQIYGAAFPSRVSVFLVEAERLDLGLALTPAVEAAVATVATRIAERLRRAVYAPSAPVAET